MAGTANPLAATGTKNRKSKNEGTAPRGKDVTLPQGNAGVKKLVGCRGSRGMREMGQLGRGWGKGGDRGKRNLYVKRVVKILLAPPRHVPIQHGGGGGGGSGGGGGGDGGGATECP